VENGRALLLVALLVAGCAPLQWTRPDASPEQMHADAEDCQQRAWRETQLRSFAYSSAYRGGRWRDPFWGDRYFEESRLTRFCMEIRGYTLQATPQH
jgi:hypothetical protein